MDNQTLVCEEKDVSSRIDKWMLEQFEELSRSQAQKWIEEGGILVNGAVVNKNYKLKLNDKVTVTKKEEPIEEIVPQNIPLDIVYEDEFLLVVNKAKGMVVHPAAGNADGTLVNALAYHCDGKLAKCNGILRQGIVHRIDKDTSGLLVVAKDDDTYINLAAQVKAHTMDRFYEAVVYGNIKDESGTLGFPIGRSNKERKQMAVTDQNSKEAVTHFEVWGRYEGFTHLRLRLETGRTHQIRVHLAYIGHPVAGDVVYGPKKAITKLHGQCLHARAIGFTHPQTLERMYFESDLPDIFINFLNALRPL